ncbi:hypothetical protein PG987_015970 [Apiospora arundinis]
MLFWVYEPYKTFIQVGLNETRTNDHGKDISAQWKSYPKNLSIDRADWALNLILDIRVTRWCYSATGEVPCKFHAKLMAERQETQLQKAISNPASLLLALLSRLFLALLVLDSLIVYIFPQLQATIFDQKYSQSYLVYNIMYYRLVDIIHIAVDIVALVASIDALFSISSIIGTFLYLAGATSFLSFATQPSPWGSLNSVYRGGVSGFWKTFWHDVFTLTLRSVTTNLASSIGGKYNLRRQKQISVMLVFLLSGIMHMSASFMVQSDTSPSHQLLFFFYNQSQYWCKQ